MPAPEAAPEENKPAGVAPTAGEPPSAQSVALSLSAESAAAQAEPYIPGAEKDAAQEIIPALSTLEPLLAADTGGSFKRELLDRLSAARLRYQQETALGLPPQTFQQAEEMRLALLLGEEIISTSWDNQHNRKQTYGRART